MMDHTLQNKYKNLLQEQGYLVNSRDMVTRAEIESCSTKAAILTPHFKAACLRIFKKNKRCQVILLSKKIYTRTVAQTGKKLLPLLDDVAQLTGGKTPCIPTLEFLANRFLLKNAILVKDEGCLCMASNFFEVHALAMVIEKACGAQIFTYFLGGGKPIKTPEALVMRFIYVMKYNKKVDWR